MKVVLFFLTLIPLSVFSQFGPGGVGSSSDNGLWLKADNILGLSDGDPVITWEDQSGNNNDASNPSTVERPIYSSNSAINGRPSIVFDGSDDQMFIGDADILDDSRQITFYTIVRCANLDGQARGILGKRVNYSTSTDYSYSFFFWSGNTLTLDTEKRDNRFNTTQSFTNGSKTMVGFDFDGSRNVDKRSRIFESGDVIETHRDDATAIGNSNQDLVLGGLNKNYHLRFKGDMSEILHYNRVLNTAEMKIVENYLASKYDFDLPNAKTIYQHRNTHAGEVAGIGQDDSQNKHNDSQGSAIVRIKSPQNMYDGDFLLWGHNEAPFSTNNTVDVDGLVIKSRMSRTWKTSEIGDVGATDVSFDLSGFSPIEYSDVRLIIDRDGDGFADNDITPLVGVVNGSTINFSNVDFEDSDEFTLGSINSVQTPLPVELTEFNVHSNENHVDVIWETASELNADYYIIQKSTDGKIYSQVSEVKANGTTSNVSYYLHEDHRPYSGVSYYRLIQVDYDGKETTYGPIAIDRVQSQSFILVPNPTSGSFRLKNTISTNHTTELEIYNVNGKLMKCLTLLPDELNVRSILLNAESGVYFVKTFVEGKYNSTLKLVVQ
ncbi:T9SS type A sorting domain-containing protein [Brumimicrobium aurantiacum]|nr:T9SS type A sorting domain-containing protein [Brumimicrobium aurantiacum]